MTHVRHRNGQNVNRDHSNGLTVRQAWAKLFTDNEKARKEKLFDAIRTDEQLVREMTRMFPDRWESCLMYQVPRVRSAFNRRKRTGWFVGIKGVRRAKRYAREGDRVYVASAHGKPEIFLGICNSGLDRE